MNKYILSLLWVLLVVIGTYSCKDSDITNEPEYGQLAKIKLDVVSSGTFEIVGLAKSGGSVDTKSFKVNVYDDSGVVVESWERYDDVPTIFGLEAGQYMAEAFSDDLKAAAWESPYYYGKQEFMALHGQVNSIELGCTLGNMKVTVGYNESFKNILKEFSVTVEILDQGQIPSGQSGSLVFDRDETRAGYFIATPLAMKIEGLKYDGTDFNYFEEITEVAPRQWHNIKLSMEDPEGDGNFNLIVDTETIDLEYNVDVPTDDNELSEGGDPTGPGGVVPGQLPTITGNGFDLDQPVVITDEDIVDYVCTVPVVVDITASSGGIQKLMVKIIMSDPNLQVLVNMMFDGDTFDLANMSAEIRETVEDLGLLSEGQVVKGLSDFSFDVTAFMGLLAEGLSVFKVTVEDGNGNTLSKELSVNRVDEL